MSLIPPNKSPSTNQESIPKSQDTASKIDPRKLVLEVAEKSPCVKRRVGAVITDADDNILATGYNFRADNGPCENSYGDTFLDVIHAEVAAYDKVSSLDTINNRPQKLYVTHEPCNTCRVIIGHLKIIVIKDCLKFDTGKLRYDLVPTEVYKGLAEIHTFGARKYKPNNWRTVDDIARFMAAAERHYQQFKKAMETGNTDLLFDEETHKHVLKHAIINLGFLLELTKTVEEFEQKREESEVYNAKLS